VLQLSIDLDHSWDRPLAMGPGGGGGGRGRVGVLLLGWGGGVGGGGRGGGGVKSWCSVLLLLYGDVATVY